jgi:peptidoglycan hydrolase FlgJ
MTNPVGLLTTGFDSTGTTGMSRPKGIGDAAGQFEGLLLEQMLKSARGDGRTGWLGSGEDQAGESMTELAEQQLARALTAGGGLGLAKLVEQAVGRASMAAEHEAPAAPPAAK